MIHVATVHWQDHRWIDVQLRYLERFMPRPYRTYAFLNGLDSDHTDRFFYATEAKVRDHATKLNLLADMISFAAADDSDALLFIDGDAFPVGEVAPLVAELDRHPIIAVKREETGDVQPHPCFCLTTVGTWREIDGDWRQKGHFWEGAGGRKVTDVGARVLRAVEERGINWRPLLRSNRQNPHRLLFGVYGDVAYHHGAGFRVARGGREEIAQAGVHEARRSLRARAFQRLPNNRLTRPLRRRFHPARRINRELQEQTQALSAEWWERIERDPDFYRELI